MVQKGKKKNDLLLIPSEALSTNNISLDLIVDIIETSNGVRIIGCEEKPENGKQLKKNKKGYKKVDKKELGISGYITTPILDARI